MLRITNLSVSLNNKPLLKNINLYVKEHSRHLITGSNGSGKSTLVNTIMGNDTYSIDKGSINFLEEDITKETTNIRALKGIFLGSQNVPEIQGLSIISLLKHSLSAHYLYNTKKDILMNDFLQQLKANQKKLNIPDEWLNRSVNVGFSGGERKKIMLLRLLMIKPKLAILDEPDSGADLKTQNLIVNVIKEMVSTTFLFISHQENFIKKISPTHISSIDNGEIINK